MNEPTSEKPTREQPEHVSEAGLAIFKGRLDHLKFLKTQQWTMTNYVALIYGAIFGIGHFYSDKHPLAPCVLKGLAIFVGIYGVVTVLIIQRHMQETRDEFHDAANWIFGEYKEAEAQSERRQVVGPTDQSTLYRDLPFLVGLMLVVIVGAALVFYFI